MKKLLHKVTHPLIELTFLIDEERILVFNGDVVMDEISADNHFKFCVGELREEIDDFLAPSPAMIQKKNLAAGWKKPRNLNRNNLPFFLSTFFIFFSLNPLKLPDSNLYYLNCVVSSMRKQLIINAFS